MEEAWELKRLRLGNLLSMVAHNVRSPNLAPATRRACVTLVPFNLGLGSVKELALVSVKGLWWTPKDQCRRVSHPKGGGDSL